MKQRKLKERQVTHVNLINKTTNLRQYFPNKNTPYHILIKCCFRTIYEHKHNAYKQRRGLKMTNVRKRSAVEN